MVLQKLQTEQCRFCFINYIVTLEPSREFDLADNIALLASVSLAFSLTPLAANEISLLLQMAIPTWLARVEPIHPQI